MIYKSSKGEVEISTMPLSYAKNAVNKLRRTEPERTAEIEALQAHVDALEAAATEKALAGEDDNPRAVVGGNNPPPEERVTENVTPKWEKIKLHMDDLLTEAQNWADGTAIVNQDQADAAGKLRQLLQDAANLADEARVAEKKPLDEQIAAIQDRYNAYIAPMKNKHPGSISKAVQALGNLLTAWLNKLDAEKREREAAAREEAEKAAAAAIAARKELDVSTDLAASEEAADLLDAAEAAAKNLRAVEREKVQAKGEFRAIGLRSYWKAVLIPGQGGTALKHYANRHPERVKSFLQTMADEDVAAGVRAIPGFDVVEEKRVA